MDNLKQKTFKAFAWDLGGKLADQGVGFFISIILARLLMPAEFGLVAMASVVVSLAKVLVDSGLGVALIQRKELTDYHYGSVFYFNMFVGSMLTIIFFLSAGYVAQFYNRPELKLIVQILSFDFIISSFSRVQSAWLTKQLKFSVLTKARVSALIIGGGTGVTLAIMGYGVWALVFQNLISSSVINLYIAIFARWRPKLIFSFDALKELWGFGFRIFLSGILNTITSQVDNLIVGKMFTPATLGFYNRAKTLNQFIIKYTSGSLMSVLFPALSSVKDEIERYKSIVFKTFNLLNVITFFLLGFLYVTVDDIIPILFTGKWVPSVIYFKIILLSGYGFPFSALLVNIISSKGNSKAFLKLEVIKQSMVVLNLSLGFLLGIEGFLYIKAIVTFIAVMLNIIFVSKEINVEIFSFYRIIIPYLLVLLISLLFIYLFNRITFIDNLYLHFIINGFIFTIIYVFLNLLFKLEGIEIIFLEMKQLINERRNK